MANRIKGITIEIGGDTTDLQKSLKEVDKTLKTTQTNLKDVNKLLKLDPSNTDLLKQKQEGLKTAIESTKDRLSQLKEAYKQLEGSDAAGAKEQQEALAREISETESRLKSLKEEYKEFGSVAKQVLTEAGDKLEKVGEKISSIGKDMTAKVTTPIVAAFTVATSKASDYTENLNKLDVAFGEYADNVRNFSDNAYLEYGLSKVDASEYAASFGAMAKGMGLSEEAAADMSVELTKLTSDLSSYFNADTETSATALEAIFTGNAQALKKFGVVMTDVNLKEFAATLGITSKEYKNLGAVDKTMLRYQYVMAQTADAQGDFARTNDDMANASRTFQASMEDLMTALGTQLLPIITPIITKVTEFIHKLAESDPALFDLITKIGLVVAAVGPALLVIGKVISIGGKLLKTVGLLFTPMGQIVTVISLIVGAGIALYENWDLVKAKASELWNGVKEVFEWIKKKITDDLTAAKDAVIRAKDGIVSGFNQIKDSIKTAVSNAWENVKSTFSNIANNISGAMETAKNAVANAIDRIKSLFNFSWELPKIKLPHFRVDGKFGWSWDGGITLPKISVEWYKKAMHNGMILDSPTIFGAMNGKLLGAGEAGSEAIVGVNSLQNMIRQAVGSNGMTINMTVNGGNVSANELAGVVIDKLKNEIIRNNNRW